MDTIVIIQNFWHKLCLWSAAAPEGVGQFRAEGQSQPVEDEVEFPAEASVYPEVEDAVKKTIGGWQPYHHKLNPLRYAATWDCCGAENMGTEEGRVSAAWQRQLTQQLLNEKKWLTFFMKRLTNETKMIMYINWLKP